MMSRTPGQKAAASQASALFGNYYPELLVRPYTHTRRPHC